MATDENESPGTALSPRTAAKEQRICSPIEELFCRAYADPQSETYSQASESAKKAGFSAKGARTAAWRALKRPCVKARLKEIYAESDFSEDRVMSNFVSDRLRAIQKGDFATAVRCDELMGKRLGLFSDRLISVFEEPARRAELDASEQREAALLATLRLRLPASPGILELPGNSSETTLKQGGSNGTGTPLPALLNAGQIAGGDGLHPPSDLGSIRTYAPR